MSFLLIGSYAGIASVDMGMIDPVRAYAGEADPMVDTDGSVSVSWQAVGDEGFANVGTARTELPGAGNNYLSMVMSGITPYVFFRDADQEGKATVMKFENDEWTVVGKAGFSVGEVEYLSMAMSDSGIPYVAYSDAWDGQSRRQTVVMKFDKDENAWLKVGGTIWYQKYTSMAMSGDTPYLAYSSGGDAGIVMKLDGEHWNQVGTPFSMNQRYISLVVLDDIPYVAYQDRGSWNAQVAVRKFSEGEWGYVGDRMYDSFNSLGTANSFAFADGVPYVAYQDGRVSGKVTVQNFDGENWSVVGTGGASNGPAEYISMAMSGSTPYVAYQDWGNDGKATVMKFDGINWLDVGEPGFSAGEVSYISMAMSGNTPYVAYRDSGKLTVMMLYYSAETPTIGAQPVGAMVKQGDASPELTIEAAVEDGGTLSYQWYRNSVNSSSGGTMIDGATTAVYYPPTNMEGTTYFYVEVTNTNVSASGDPTALVVSDAVAVTIESVMEPEWIPQIAAGNNHVMWMKSNGEVWAWGIGKNGQLGIGVNYRSYIPIETNMSDVKKMAVGASHTLWLKEDGSLYAAGQSVYGQLGNGMIDGSYDVYHAPVEILEDVIDIAARDLYSFALKSDGTVWGWGDNGFRQLGIAMQHEGGASKVAAPTKIEELSNIQKVFAGNNMGYAINEDGEVWVWGMNLFKSGSLPWSEPYLLTNITEVTQISVGSGFTLFLKEDGTVWAVGANDFGQLGNGTIDRSDAIIQVNGLENIVAISSSSTHNLALTHEGEVYAWGENGSGGLGLGSTESEDEDTAPVLLPTLVPDLHGVIAIEAAGSYKNTMSIVLKDDNSVWGWGKGGELGIGVYVKDLFTPALIAFEEKPTLEAVTLSDDNSQIELIFNRDLAAASMAELDGKVYLARGGVQFEPLDTTDDLFFVGEAVEHRGKLIINLWEELQGTDNVIKVKDGALQDAFGNKPGEVVTNAIIANEHTYSIAAVEDQIIPELLVGYSSGSPEKQTIRIHNTGTINIKDVKVALSGSAEDAFTITQPFSHRYEPLLVGGDASFTVQAVDGLTVGTYTAEVVVSARGVTYTTFEVTQVVKPLDPPANVVAVPGDGQIDVSWDTVTNATYYDLYMTATSGQYTEPVIVDDIIDTEYRMQGLTNGKTYYFTVRAGYGEDRSGASDEVGAMPIQLPVIDTQPVGTTVKLDDSHPVLRVVASVEDGGTLSYQWYSNSVDSNIGGTMINGATNATYEVSTDVEGTYYYYVEVTNTNIAVSGSQTITATSEAAQVTVNLPNAPDAPQRLTALAGDRQATLGWETVTGATYYHLYTSTISGQFDDEIFVSVTDATYHMKDLTNGTSYYFIVRAESHPGVLSAASNEIHAIPLTVPSAPTGVTAIAGDRSAVVSFNTPADDGGSPITDYEVLDLQGNVIATGTSSPITVTGLSNGETYRFIVKAMNRAGKSAESIASNEVVPNAQSHSGGNGGNDGDDQGDDQGDDDQTGPVFPPVDLSDDLKPEGEEQETQVDILINGNVINAGKASTMTINDQQMIAIAVDSEGLGEYLEEGNQGDVISIPVLTPADVVRTTFNGQLIKSMEQSEAFIELITEHATYTIPASQLQIDTVVKQLGSHLTLKDIEVQIEISSLTADQLQWIEDVAENGEFTIVAPPLHFTVTGVYEGTSVEISTFNTYTERTIAIPDNIDPGKMTTAVVVEEDGTVRHVPTKIVFEGGRYIAVINSPTNSTYALIWNPVAFRDVADHWAKDAINNMGARKIVSGVGENTYQPNRDITRAEFAAIVVRTLGLKIEDGPTPFTDVKKSDWYSEVVQTAYAYNLISGYENGTFRPTDKITREQAMVIIAKAMEITKLIETLGGKPGEHPLHTYADADQISNWAKDGVTKALQANIISGRSHTELAPKANITRAEVALIVERLLQESKLL